ncbi:hypothetical protein PENTCL1PPCAC_3451, partial [Pristionchus entomophagus]
DKLRDRVISAVELTGQALVDYINTNVQTFKAKLNTRFANRSERAKTKAINGVAPSIDELASQLDREGRVTHTVLADELPEFFDARAAWPTCKTIGLISDQSNCGSCWAVSTGEVIADRICIASGGSQHVNVSSDDIMSCCVQCGNGCDGGDPFKAVKWYMSHGVVTGSDYDAHAGCKPYPFPSCEHHTNNPRYESCDSEPDFWTPRCRKSCQDGYTLTYAQDKHYGVSAYGVSRKVADIQKEIFSNGPVTATFTVYEDFEQYASGIYVHKSGKYLGTHAVKVIGWGTEGSTPYWLVANSWNTDWGENGLFRIIRGTNEVGFEAAIIACLPKL